MKEMTDYEKLIKEARTLEGMYFKGKKIIQVWVSKVDDDYSIGMQDIHDIDIFDIDFNHNIDDILDQLENFKKQCYTRFEEVVTMSAFDDNVFDRNIDQSRAVHFLKTISDVEIVYTDSEEDITPIKELKKEIKQILNDDN